jgi:cytochrome c6
VHSVKPNRAILRQHIYQSFFSQMQKIIFTRFTRIIATVALLSAATFSSVASANDEAGKLLFLKGASPACAICHTLEAAGAAGAVGPSMNELQPDAARVVNALKNGIGQMPAYTSLTPEQVKILSEYVAKASRQ